MEIALRMPPRRAPASARPAPAFALVALAVLHGAMIWLLCSARVATDRPLFESIARLIAPRLHARQVEEPSHPASGRHPAAAVSRASPETEPDHAGTTLVPPGAAQPSSVGSDAETAGRPGDAASAPLSLAIPRSFFERRQAPTPAQEAAQDPRSNTLVLTSAERMAIALGQIECVAWVRRPDGTIYRGPGHLQRVQDVGTNPFTAQAPGGEDRPTECVE
jgi:hypothetical protein